MNNWEWMVQDGPGSVRGMTDNASAVLWSGSYDPFGTSFGANGTVQTTYGFTGERYDAGTDLLYLRARHYKPGLGRFTARDPFEGVLSRAMSLNAYSWVERNVPNLFDPSGLQAVAQCRMLAQSIPTAYDDATSNLVFLTTAPKMA